MWAMGCIMLQVAVLVVWGWESERVSRFRTERESFVARAEQQSGRPSTAAPGDSFVKSTPVIDKWLCLMQEADGSATLQGYLRIAVRMLSSDPLERILSWEAELELYELLNPDESKTELSMKTAALVQPPTRNRTVDGIETPLHRAAAEGNYIRVIELLGAGWPAQSLDKMQRTPLELAELNGHTYLGNVLSCGDSIRQWGQKYALAKIPPIPAIHIRERRGFRLRQVGHKAETWAGPGQPPCGDDQDENRPETVADHELQVQDSEAFETIAKAPECTELHVAAQRGDVAHLASLLGVSSAKNAVTLADAHGRTPLHYAAMLSAEAVTMILQSTADTTHLLLAADRRGRIPLHLAIETGREDTVQAILRACPDGQFVRNVLLHEDHGGVTPLDIAIQSSSEVQQILFDARDSMDRD